MPDLHLVGPARRSHTDRVLWAIGTVSAAGGGVLLVRWFDGDRTFVTHPVAVTGLLMGAVAVAVLARRVDGPTRWALQALAASLALYLALGAWASTAPGPVAAGLWSVGWVPPTAGLAVAGLAHAGLVRAAVALAAAAGLVAVAGAVLIRPVAPFVGIGTAAPQAWVVAAPALVDGLLIALNLLLALAVSLVVRQARRASVVDRRRLARDAALTSTALCSVVCCLALAVVRDPGDVDPATGSVAYLLIIAGIPVLVAHAVGQDDRWVVRTVVALWGGAITLIAAVAVVGAIETPAPAALAACALTVAVTALVMLGVRRFEAWTRPAAPRAVTVGVPGLTPRENDVLAGVAAGRTNAGIAADLFLSERTVEQHLRSVFDKLGLGGHGDSNRRVRAAAVWWQRQTASTGASDPSVGQPS